MKDNQAWEHFDHDADIGVRGFGATKAAAFEQAAMALTAVITDPDLINDEKLIQISCEAAEDDVLFYDWLNALIYEMTTAKMLFKRFEVSIDEHQLTGKAWGEPIDVEKHKPTVEIKGATFTALSVGQDEKGDWYAQCIVDV